MFSVVSEILKSEISIQQGKGHLYQTTFALLNSKNLWVRDSADRKKRRYGGAVNSMGMWRFSIR